MNRSAHNLLRSLLAVGFLFTAYQSQAHPPLQHPARGVIQSLDLTNHTLVLAEPKTATNRVFIWKSYTRFRVGWHKASPASLQPGQSIKVSYRREIGRLVLYEVRWSEATPGVK